MMYGAPPKERRRSDRIKHAFSFHIGDQVLIGRDLSSQSLGVYCPVKSSEGLFYFYKGQKVKDCYIQIEGETFYFTYLKVMRLEQQEDDTMNYGIEIEFMIQPERQRFEAFYLTLSSTKH